MKFVHCADIHLDAPFISLGIKDDNSFMSVSKSAIRRMDLKNTFKNIMEIARDEGAGYIFISGDLYEHNYVRKSTINYVNGIFKSLGNYKIKIFIVPGNHDPWVKGSYYTDFEWAGNVYILAGDKTHVCFEEEGICIYSPGAFPGIFTEGGNFDVERPVNRHPIDGHHVERHTIERYTIDTIDRHIIERYHADRHPIEQYRVSRHPVNPDFINILLLHGTLDWNTGNTGSIGKGAYNPVSSRELELLGMDYIALGHFHKRADAIGNPGIVYNPGSPEPLGFDEPGEHGVYVGNIVKRGNVEKALNVKFIATNAKRYETLRIDISGCVTDEEVMARINSVIDGTATGGMPGEALLLGIVLCGYIEPRFTVDMEYILSCLEDRVFYAKIENRAVPDYDFDEIKKEVGIKGLFAKKMLDLIEEAKNGHERELLVKALYYGIQAIEDGKVNISS